jgi:hypothetical protein
MGVMGRPPGSLSRKLQVIVTPGDRYGCMVAIREGKRQYYGGRMARMVLVRCDCGNVITKALYDLRSGHYHACCTDCPLHSRASRSSCGQFGRRKTA